ncbi:MAG: nitrous oxide reductase accessory protein NosL, partial [Roseibacillus sp.]|nr:nitrous oxide reductase accessory protein NosL [Roseibacillus sp.]
MTRSVSILLLALLAQWGLACDSPEAPLSRPEIGPEAISNQEDAVCGMLVREQSAPRAQVIHRDGTRAFFCSVADLLAYLEAPSPHGAVLRTYLEVMEPDESPAQLSVSPYGTPPGSRTRRVSSSAAGPSLRESADSPKPRETRREPRPALRLPLWNPAWFQDPPGV